MRMNVRLSVHAMCSSDIYADMIIDNDPSIERHISVPRDMSQLSCSSFTAGIVEAVLDGLGFVRLPITSPKLPDLISQNSLPE
jgi:Transport protein particle (TRAPP) component